MANQKPYDHFRFSITLFLILNFFISQTTSIPSRMSLLDDESKPSVVVTSKEQISCTMCTTCDNPCQPPPSPPPPVIECPPPPPPPPAVPECPPPPKPPTCDRCFESPPSDTGNIYPPPAGGSGGGGGSRYPSPFPGNFPFDHSPPNYMVPYFPYYYDNPPQLSFASHSLLNPLSKIIILISSLLLLRV